MEILHIAAEEIRRICPNADFKLVLMNNHEDNINIRNGQIEKMLHASASSLAMNLLIDGRDGFFYTNNLQDSALKQFIKHAAETTQMLEPDESRTLADPSRYYKGGGPDLKNFDESLSTIDPSEKLRLAQQNNQEGISQNSNLISFQTHYTDRQHQAHYLISNGFQGYEQSSRCTLTSIATADGKDGQHPADGWGETRIFLKDMPSEGIARVAIERTLRKIGSRPTSSGQYRMILESPVVGSFLQPILNAMNGQYLHGKMSFLAGKLHQQVLSPLVNIVDDPLIPGTRGACYFDYDGVATKRRSLFTEGILDTFFIDTIYANKLKMSPTTQGTHHLIMQSGNKSLQQLIAESDNTIIVTDFNGGNCDPTTGNFSYGIEGFLIQNGVIVQPVSGMNITGNILDVWQRVSDLGNDVDPWETELLPSIVFEDVSFGGL
ncbi:MAG: TldD/PmbA family protein [Bacteroidaceae bacterium]|nr:TldD/PmbA family protein [Bacteroidaceae bacterium]